MLMKFTPPMIAVFLISAVNGDDWPQWMGADRDGAWHEDGVLDEFPKEGPTLRWTQKIGTGYSGPAVADGFVYVMDRIPGKLDGEATYLHEGDVPKNHNFVRQLLPGTERVVCLRESDGEVQWVYEYDCPYSTVSTYAIGPRATPTVADGHVYVVGAEGHLTCLDARSGRVVWKKDYARDFGQAVPNWGFSAPPLVDENLLICIVGGRGSTVVAFDRMTGNIVWRALDASEPGYSAPVIRTINDERQLLIWDADAVSGLDPRTGKVFWTVPFPSTFKMSIATPQVAGNSIFVMCFNGKCALVTVGEDGRSAALRWTGGRRKGIDGVHNTAQIIDGHIYGCGNGGRYICARLSDGEQLWSTFDAVSAKRPIYWGNVFTVRHQDRFFLANDIGELIIAKLSPAGYEEISKAQLIDPTHDIGARRLVWSHPAFANRSVYLRNDKEIRCYSLAK